MTVGTYVRGSTADQNLNRQLTSTGDYARDQLGAELAEIVTYRDKITGTNTERSGYRELMADVDDGEIKAVGVHEISRMARSLQISIRPWIASPTPVSSSISFATDSSLRGRTTR